jgi:hypothetical protein
LFDKTFVLLITFVFELLSVFEVKLNRRLTFGFGFFAPELLLRHRLILFEGRRKNYRQIFAPR